MQRLCHFAQSRARGTTWRKLGDDNARKALPGRHGGCFVRQIQMPVFTYSSPMAVQWRTPLVFLTKIRQSHRSWPPIKPSTALLLGGTKTKFTHPGGRTA